MATLQSQVEKFFSPKGQLARNYPHFETRPEQGKLSLAVAKAITEAEKLVAEAGTGIGKTLAYLLPAVASNLRVVISTGTKNLQEQLVFQDLPILQRALGRKISFQILKGRANYLCLYRANRFARQPFFPNSQDDCLYQTIMDWQATTHTGDRAELTDLSDDSRLWPELSATSEQCLGRNCPEFEICWVTMLRRQAQSAQLVIVNHHLYFADLVLGLRSENNATAVLPQYDLAIFDEAHYLVEVSSKHFGYQVSQRRIDVLIIDTLAVTRDCPARHILERTLDGLRIASHAFFSALAPRFELGRVAVIDKSSFVLDSYVVLADYLRDFEAWLGSSTIAEAQMLGWRVASIDWELAFILDVKPKESQPDCLNKFQAQDPDNYVRFIEIGERQRTLVAKPIDVSDLVGDALESILAIFISATLSVEGDFSLFRRQLGLRKANSILVGSPFDFEANVRLYTPLDLPEPDYSDFSTKAAQRAVELIEISAGGAFILCTSYKMLSVMRAALTGTSFLVLTQGEAPRHVLIERFRECGNAVLVATLSFWQGVDVPGMALRLVILDKLPFASPTDPVVSAKIARMRELGEDPFFDYQVPQAALLLRQGFGRLIRRKSDKGLVAVLDRRIVSRGYGKIFLRSLPTCPHLTNFDEARDFLDAINLGQK